MKLTLKNIGAGLLAIAGMAGSAVCFKISAESWDVANGWAFGMLILGALVSFLHPVGTTIALRGQNANIVFATIGGPGLVVTQLTLAAVFRYPMHWWQWGAIAVILIGVLLLQPVPAKTQEANSASASVS